MHVSSRSWAQTELYMLIVTEDIKAVFVRHVRRNPMEFEYVFDNDGQVV
jgi:chorismate mutase